MNDSLVKPPMASLLRETLVVGNWKMNGSLSQSLDRLSAIAECLSESNAEHSQMIVCAPFVHLYALAIFQNENALDERLQLGAQDLSAFESGAHTGEINALMLSELGCTYVIVGHSERRQFNRETNEDVALKAHRAQEGGLIPIICVGETLQERQNNLTLQVIESQLSAALEKLSNDSKYVIAYEPVWAIGSGLAATPDEAQLVHAAIRSIIAKRDKTLAKKLQILYGGSVKADNAKALLVMPDIDGFLVGGSSLDPQAFIEISQMG